MLPFQHRYRLLKESVASGSWSSFVLRSVVAFSESFYKGQSAVYSSVYFVSTSGYAESVWICCKPCNFFFFPFRKKSIFSWKLLQQKVSHGISWAVIEETRGPSPPWWQCYPPLLHPNSSAICFSVLLLSWPVSLMAGTGCGGLIAGYGYWELDPFQFRSRLKPSSSFAAGLTAVASELIT